MKYRDGKSSAIKGRGKSVHVYTDGHRMRKLAVFPQSTNGRVRGVRVSENIIRPFVFADIRTTGAGHPHNPNHSVLCSRTIQMKTLYLTMSM